MSETIEEYDVNPHHFVDSVTKEIAEVLLESPKYPITDPLLQKQQESLETHSTGEWTRSRK